MSNKSQTRRPALRRSVDADVHPALAGRSTTMPTSGAAPSKRAAERSGKSGQGKKRATTSDVYRPTKKDPPVKLAVVLPKSVRKRLRKAAEQRGLSAEELAARFIAEGMESREF